MDSLTMAARLLRVLTAAKKIKKYRRGEAPCFDLGGHLSAGGDQNLQISLLRDSCVRGSCVGEVFVVLGLGTSILANWCV